MFTAVNQASNIDAPDTLKKLCILLPALIHSRVLSRNIDSNQTSGLHFSEHPFDLDGFRDAHEIVNQGIGGSCGSYGRVLAAALIASNSDENKVYLVDTVGESARISRTDSSTDCSVSGHQFLLVENCLEWFLVNPRQ